MNSPRCKHSKYDNINLRRRRIVLMQPLPSVAFASGTEAYSEFASLGLAILAGHLRMAGMENAKILYPESAADAVHVTRDADVVVLGDFRYYSYFCNPKPLLQRIIDALRADNFAGLVLIAGRHSAYMKELSRSTQLDSLRIFVCTSMSDLANVLGIPDLVDELGRGALPRPAEAPADLLLSKNLNRSASRPAPGIIGQVLIRSGCFQRCGFCEKAAQQPVYISNTVLRKHLLGLREIGTDYLVVWDDTFGELSGGYDEALRMIRDAGIPFGCNTRANLLTDRFVEKLAESGCREVLIGIEVAPMEEDASKTLRRSRSKALKSDKLLAIVDRLTKQSIKPVGSIIIGLPDDNMDRIEKRINDCLLLGFQHLYVRPLVPFPGTLFYQEQVAAKIINTFEYWATDIWDTYPHGYPTMCVAVDREKLCKYANRPN